jgi:hypothetical protein
MNSSDFTPEQQLSQNIFALETYIEEFGQEYPQLCKTWVKELNSLYAEKQLNSQSI